MSDDLPMGWVDLPLELVGMPSTPNIDPSKFSNEIFELYSVPSYTDDEPEILPSSEIHSTKQSVEMGDVLLCKIVPHLNRVWIVKELLQHRQIASGEWIVIRSKIAISDYLRYALTDSNFRSAFMATSSGVGGSLMRARPKAVAQIPIPIAPLNEQRRIVDKLERIGDRHRTARNELSHIPKLIARYKQAVLTAACSGKLTEDWREKNSNVDSALKLIETIREKKEKNLTKVNKNISVESFSLQNFENELPEIPDTWLWCSLGSYANCSRGKFTIRPRNDPKYFDGQYPFIQIGDLPREGGYILTHRQTLNDDGLSVSKMFSSGTVVIAIVGATIGNTGILSYDMCFPDSLVGIDTGSQHGNFYLEYYLRSQKENIRDFSYAGGGQPNIKLETLNLYPFPLPPLEEQKEIVRRVEKMFEKIDRMEQEYQKAAKLCDRLEQATLAKAFRGELVPQDPDDEPASVLLEQVKREKHVQPKGKSVKSK